MKQQPARFHVTPAGMIFSSGQPSGWAFALAPAKHMPKTVHPINAEFQIRDVFISLV